MGRTRKNSKSYYGMKVHVGVDEKSGLIHRVECTPANVNDIEKMTDLMNGEEEVIIGDKGYWSKTKKKEFRGRGIYSMILHKRVKHRDALPNELSQKQESQNKKWSKVRAKVEHVFCIAKSLWKQTKTKYKGLQKNTQRWYLTMGLVNLYKARHLL